MGVEGKLEWSEIESIDGKKGPNVEAKSGGMKTIMCEVGLKVNLMWGGIKG